MMYGKDPDAHIDDVRQLFRNSAATSSGLGYLYQLAAVACWTSLFFLPLIRQPTLVMGGDSDPLVPVTNARILAGLIPNATLAGLFRRTHRAACRSRHCVITDLAFPGVAD